ncbi:MAG TPA: alpha/beta hydrolase [Chryseolinea sp.]
MVARLLKIIIFIIGGILSVAAILILILWMKSPGRAEPIADANGKMLEGSISTIEKVTLGGQEQYLFIRGASLAKPVMLFVHGGPGSPELSFMKNYNSDIENDFIMVYWEQRGAGKSYSENIPIESMTLTQFISDTKELSEYLSNRFNQEKIYLMGHSWGSLLGILTAYHYPERFHAYFGIGQVANQYKGEKLSFEWVKEQAHQRDDYGAVKKLSEMKFPDSLASSDEWIKFVMNERRYVIEYGGSMRQLTGIWPMVKLVLSTEEYTLGDKFNYMKGNIFSLEHLWPEVIKTNLFNAIDSMQVPVYIFQGLYDYQTPPVIAKAFYDQLKAPEKEFFTFTNSAHSPLMEEVEKFNSLVREKAGIGDDRRGESAN